MKKLLTILSVVILFAACSFGQQGTIPKNGPNTITIQGGRLALKGCTLSYERGGITKNLSLKLNPPCFFAENKEKKAGIVQTKYGSSLIIGSYFNDKRSTITSVMDDGCRTALRGVLVTKTDILLSPEIKKVAQCSKGPWDRKMYEIFAYTAIKTSQK